MKLLLLMVCGALAAIRHHRISPRQVDKVHIAALACTAAVAIHIAPVAVLFGKLAGEASQVLSTNLFLVAIWSTREALMDAVRRPRHRAYPDQGAAMLLVTCLLCWLGFSVGGSGYRPDGTATGLAFAVGHLYMAGSFSMIAAAALGASRIARTSGVKAGSTLLGISAGALAVIALLRTGIYALLLAGALPMAHSLAYQHAASAVMTAAGIAGLIGLSMPALGVLRPWLHDALWALRCLKTIRPLWDRASASSSCGHQAGSWSVSRTDPVARLHRRVVEIRDAELAQLINLRTRETAMIESIEDKLTRGFEIREAA